MYAKHTVSIADTTITNYTVSADELHIFIADTIKRFGGNHGTFVEKQIWRNCGKPTHWKITD